MKQYTAKIIVAAHKPYTMPDDEMYLPVHVGAAEKKVLDIREMMRVKIFPALTHIFAN